MSLFSSSSSCLIVVTHHYREAVVDGMYGHHRESSAMHCSGEQHLHVHGHRPFLWLTGLNPRWWSQRTAILSVTERGKCGRGDWTEGVLLVQSQDDWAVMLGFPFTKACSRTHSAGLDPHHDTHMFSVIRTSFHTDCECPSFWKKSLSLYHLQILHKGRKLMKTPVGLIPIKPFRVL